MPSLPAAGTFVTRIWRPDIGPSVALHRDGDLIDITNRATPTMRDLLERDDLPAYLAAVDGTLVTTGPVVRHHALVQGSLLRRRALRRRLELGHGLVEQAALRVHPAQFQARRGVAGVARHQALVAGQFLPVLRLK